MLPKLMLALAAFFATGTAWSQIYHEPFSDDSDLTGPSVFGDRFQVPPVLTPDEIVPVTELPGRLVLNFYVARNGQYQPIVGLQIPLGYYGMSETDYFGTSFLECTGVADLSIPTRREGRFHIGGFSSIYSLSIRVPCGHEYNVLFHEGTEAGELMALFETLSRAELALEENVGTEFWRNPIGVVWPADGDYYSWGTVHVTKGYQWDVVGHEFGHAIYDQANLGRFGGGQHRIDECYSEAMALSEGWASYFAAWLYVDLSDPDAKFQYMVPRRAPIQFENIPDDVCAGPANEWRVTGFFWDLIDFNRDGEGAEYMFIETWQALLNSNASGPTAAYRILKNAGIDAEDLERVWLNNFLTPAPRN